MAFMHDRQVPGPGMAEWLASCTGVPDDTCTTGLFLPTGLFLTAKSFPCRH